MVEWMDWKKTWIRYLLMALQWLWVYLHRHKASKASQEDTCVRMGLQQIEENTWENLVDEWLMTRKHWKYNYFRFWYFFYVVLQISFKLPCRVQGLRGTQSPYCVVQLVLRSKDTDMGHRYDTTWIRRYGISLKSNSKTQWGYVILYMFTYKNMHIYNHKFGSQLHNHEKH